MKNAHLMIAGAVMFASLIFSLRNTTVFAPGAGQDIFAKSASPTPSPVNPLNQPLQPVPQTIKAVYLTAYSGGNNQKISEIISLANETELNAAVIDIKDYTGRVAFDTDSELINSLGAEQIKIPNLKALVAQLHQNKIYAIARIAVFQDPYLATKRPDLAVKNSKTGGAWKDRKGLSWVEMGSQEVWDYNLIVAQEAIKLGFDEINLDYVRFPSDGDMSALSYTFYNSQTETKAEQMREFFEYFSDKLRPSGVKLSVDLFGLAAVNRDDLGIGQVLEYAFPYFDYIAPMVYPSHYASGFLGYKNPSLYPYEVIDYSLRIAQTRRKNLAQALQEYETATSTQTMASSTLALVKNIKLEKIGKGRTLGVVRPWLQVFNLGATYRPEMIRSEIQAVYDNQLGSGWYLWNPSNIYNIHALMPE